MSDEKCKGSEDGTNRGSECEFRDSECYYCDRPCPWCDGCGAVDDSEGGTHVCTSCNKGHPPEDDEFDQPLDRRDMDGKACTLDVLCLKEPAWAANRIRMLERQRKQLDTLLTLSREAYSLAFRVADEARGIKRVHPATIIDRRVFIDHAKEHVTQLAEGSHGCEIQPIVNMRPINPAGEVRDTHIIILPRASSLEVTWHESYRWPSGYAYTPSDGTDMVTVVMDRDGSMLATAMLDFR